MSEFCELSSQRNQHVLIGINHSKDFHSQILPKDPLMKYEHNAVAQ